MHCPCRPPLAQFQPDSPALPITTPHHHPCPIFVHQHGPSPRVPLPLAASCPAPQDELSGADIKAVCTEAGLLALRERRMRVTQADFRKAKEKVLYKKKEGVPEGLYL